MAKTKKVLLFLVEGITDKETLGLILSKLMNTEDVHFEITGGDITSRYGVNHKNVKNKVWDYVKGFMIKSRYQKTDILKIIHLIDTDGAFVPDELIRESKTERIQYCSDHINTSNVSEIMKRNHNKTEVSRCLSQIPGLGGIPYQIYYFSRNLEHVLHGTVEEMTKEEKMDLADEFLDRYTDTPEEFIHLLQDVSGNAGDDYKESWKFIFEGPNSLQRHSNLGIIWRNT